MSEDFYYQRLRGGVREPDPTLGKNIRRATELAAAEADPAAWTSGGGQGTQGGQNTPEKPPRRTRVVLADGKKTANSLRARVELEEQTSWGEMLIKDLVRAQFRAGMLFALLMVLALGSLPLVFYLLPEFAGMSVAGVPVAWLLLGVLPFPFLFGIGLWYNRRAEANERDFVHMIEN